MSIKRNLFRFIFVSVLGVLLHFTYEWSGENPVVALFSAVNESTWEHLKLLFFPMLILTIIEMVFFSEKLPENFLSSRTCGIISGMLFIVAGFYTLTGVIGKSYDFLNIALYFAAVIFSLWVENKRNGGQNPNEKSSYAMLLAIALAFFVFTFYPPNIGLFISPV